MAKDLFCQLQAEASEPFAPDQLRTLQRRVKQWRTEIVRRLVFDSGLETAEEFNVPAEPQEKEMSS